ncbi:MAG: hypothetical protein JO317_06475 [Verrucomicrobiae bacterium]|nr:hypothetical protein [Verrucomicrobiae bacterium]
MAAGYAEMLTAFGTTFTWNAVSYSCIQSNRTKGRLLDDGGYFDEEACRLLVRKSDFPSSTPPAIGALVTLSDGQVLRVAKVLSTNPSGRIILILSEKTQKR